MYKENIGTDRYGRTMHLYHSCNTVYCDHVKNDKVVRTNQIKVDNDIILMFSALIRAEPTFTMRFIEDTGNGYEKDYHH